MKIYIYILLSSIGLCCLAFYFNPYIHTKANPAQTKELASISHPIRTINPVDTNYQDLAFLKDKLKGVDMVMLGEQSHGDGSAFLAKSRLIQFLHQEMDFDVLLFESGIYDCFNLWKELSETPAKLPNTFNRALFYFWGASNETKNLRTYIMQHAQSARPLILGGFDLQLSGAISGLDRIQSMKLSLAKKNILFEKDCPYFSKIMEDYYQATGEAASKAMSEAHKNVVFDELNTLITRLAGHQKTNEDKILFRYLLGIKTQLHYEWTHHDNMDKRMAIRDSMMAANTIWLKEHFYKNKKIILWAANTHIACNSKNFINRHKRDKKMGDYLKEKYGSACYGVNFTSHSGKTYHMMDGKVFQVNESMDCSIESMLHTTGNPLAFIDLRSISKNSFLNKKITMKLWFYYNETETWRKMTDGIFFIDQMKPITFN